MARAAGLDTRVKAVATLDGQLFKSSVETGVPAPYMLLMGDPVEVSDAVFKFAGITKEQYDEIWAGFEGGWRKTIDKAKPDYQLRLAGSRHLSFSADRR